MLDKVMRGSMVPDKSLPTSIVTAAVSRLCKMQIPGVVKLPKGRSACDVVTAKTPDDWPTAAWSMLDDAVNWSLNLPFVMLTERLNWISLVT